MTETLGLVSVLSPKGNSLRFAVRDDTSDAALAMGIAEEDEYSIASLPSLSGWAIDIGAHIGIVAVALAVDHPELQVIAVEALAENALLIAENAMLNGVAERVEVICAAAADDDELTVPITYGWEKAQNQPDGYMHDSRYIGGMVGPNETSRTVECPAIGLAAIFEARHIDRAALLKIDCEGCEWYVLRSPAVERIDRIIGEFHIGRSGKAGDLRRLLGATHNLEYDDTKVVGLFQASLKWDR